MLAAEAARDYHSTQIETFADTAAEMVTAITMTYAEEAIGIAAAATAAGIPVAISFTRRDRRAAAERPAARRGDRPGRRRDRRGPPAYFMINCAHPTHFEGVLGGRPG